MGLVSRTQCNATPLGGVVHCRSGTASGSELGKVPDLRSSVRTLHRVRDTVENRRPYSAASSIWVASKAPTAADAARER